MNQRSVNLILLFALMFGLFSGCSKVVRIHLDEKGFQPERKTPIEAIENLPVNFMAIQLKEQNTADYYFYYSPDFMVQYETAPSLTAYLQVTMEKAFRTGGIIVFPEEEAHPKAPSLKVSVLSLDDEKISAQVELMEKGRVVYQEIVTLGDIEKPKKMPKGKYKLNVMMKLEARAYYMVEALAWAIMQRQGFQETLMRIAPDVVVERKTGD